MDRNTEGFSGSGYSADSYEIGLTIEALDEYLEREQAPAEIRSKWERLRRTVLETVG
jgi:hypothetical protein